MTIYEYEGRISRRLAEIRKQSPVVSVGFNVDVERKARELLNRYGLPMVPYRCFMQYARSLARIFRDFEGQERAQELVLAMGRWVGHGLDFGLVGRFTSDLHEAVFGSRFEPEDGDGKEDTV